MRKLETFPAFLYSLSTFNPESRVKVLYFVSAHRATMMRDTIFPVLVTDDLEAAYQAVAEAAKDGYANMFFTKEHGMSITRMEEGRRYVLNDYKEESGANTPLRILFYFEDKELVPDFDENRLKAYGMSEPTRIKL
jgi:hypothetical protein